MSLRWNQCSAVTLVSILCCCDHLSCARVTRGGYSLRFLIIQTFLLPFLPKFACRNVVFWPILKSCLNVQNMVFQKDQDFMFHVKIFTHDLLGDHPSNPSPVKSCSEELRSSGLLSKNVFLINLFLTVGIK